MTTDPNPFTGRTRYRSRPTWSLPEYRHLTLSDLHRAQTHWDHAEQVRLAQSAAEAARFAELIADESVEEPASKALENRLRVAFLSRAGATMQDWLHRPTILSSATAGPRSSLAVLGADLERRAEPC